MTIDAKDEAEYAQVCVIGDEIRRNLFGYGPAIGKQLKVNDVWLEVVGIFAGEMPGGSGTKRAISAGVRSGSSPSVTITFDASARARRPHRNEAPCPDSQSAQTTGSALPNSTAARAASG